MTTATTFSPPRVTMNLAHAWGGLWRLTFRQLLQPSHLLGLGVGFAVLVLVFVAGSRGTRPAEFVQWLSNFYVCFLVPALAFISTAGAMRDGMKSSAVDYLLTRPLPKPAYVVFKYVAHMLCTQLDFIVAFAIVIAFASGMQVPELGAVLVKLLFGQVLMIAAFSAFGVLAAVITSRYVVIGLGYTGVIEMGLGQIPTQLSQLSMTHLMRDTLASLLRPSAETVAAHGLAATTGIVLLFVAIMVGAAVAVFSLREQSGPAE